MIFKFKSMITRPELEEAQFALLITDGQTGHVLTKDLQIYRNDGKEIYQVFNSIESVNDYIKKIQAENDALEFSIYSGDYVLIDFRKSSKW